MVPPIPRLTERQKQCLRLVGRGAQYKEIAAELGIAPDTAKNHLKAAMQAFGVSSRYQAARLLQEQEGAPTPSPQGASPPPPVAGFAQFADKGASAAAVDTGDTDHLAASFDRVEERQAAYFANLPHQPIEEPLRIPIIGGVRDELKTWQIALLCLAVAAFAIFAVAAVIKVDYEVGLSRHPQQPR